MDLIRHLPPASFRRVVAPAAVLGVFAVALLVLRRSLSGYDWERLPADLVTIGTLPAILAVLATAASYLAMTGYDALALRYVEHPLPYRRYAAASFVATAFGNSLGASALVGAALRARVYSAWQVPGFAITRIIAFNTVTLGLGFAVLAGGGMLLHPERVGEALRVSTAGTVAIAALVLAPVIGYLAWSRSGGSPIVIRHWRIDRPSRPLGLAQTVLSTLEVTAMAAALWVLLPAELGVGFVPFVTAFAIAVVAGLVSNVPGGVGVFESVLIVLLSVRVPAEELAPALVAFRLAYFVLPLVLAAVVLVGLEARRGRDEVTGASRSELVQRVGVLTPSLLALMVAGLGVVLVATGEVPWLRAHLPRGSAFAVSLVGVGLLLLARGLHRRLREAWIVTQGVLLAQVALCLMVGARIPGLAGLGLIALLAPAGGVFHRRTHVFGHPRGWTWTAVAGGLVTGSLWWHEAVDHSEGEGTFLAMTVGQDHPLHVRTAALLGMAGVLLAGNRLLRPVVPGPRTSCPAELDRAEQIVAAHGRPTAHLVFTGDKRLLFSRAGDAFLMYQVEGRSWISMGGPVGDPGQFRELLVEFIELAERHDGRPVLYGVDDEHTGLCRELGLGLSKLGEEAVIELADFDLTGKRRARMRRWVSINERAGCTVEVRAAGEIDDVLPELREISDEWLAERHAKEKRFSLGPFDDDYVRRFPVALLRCEGRLIAFATLWIGHEDGEVAVDLMRQRDGGPPNVMNYLFVQVMLWAREQDHQRFSLGMAPLSGLRTDATAPFWDRIGGMVFRHGEHFYNFQGVRHFKECFHPFWRPRYVACPPGLGFPTAMLNVATLVGGGVRGLVSR
jgi:lysylphosphatidylglycerol synthetase-like protein (DUF2156 family)